MQLETYSVLIDDNSVLIDDNSALIETCSALIETCSAQIEICSAQLDAHSAQIDEMLNPLVIAITSTFAILPDLAHNPIAKKSIKHSRLAPSFKL